MNKFRLTFIIALAAITFTSCKKKDDDSNSSKSLNKSTFAPNTWYNKGGSIIHIIQAGGKYSNTGTWAWKNGSDTLEIATTQGGAKTYWKVYWNTSTEMECQRVGTPSPELYKTQLW